MNVYPNLDAEYARWRDEAVAALRSCGAFLRADRGSALFVSDAPRHGFTASTSLAVMFTLKQENQLLFLSPRLTDVPETLRVLYLHLLKSAPARRDRLLRQALAKSLRLHHAEEVQFLKRIFEGGD